MDRFFIAASASDGLGTETILILIVLVVLGATARKYGAIPARSGPDRITELNRNGR